MRRTAVALVIALTTAAPAAGAPPRVALRVAPYPYIPEADAAWAWMEQAFEAEHPEVDLVRAPLPPEAAYDEEGLVRAVSAADVAEVDAVWLGRLRARVPLAALRGRRAAPVAQDLARAGVAPTWLCTFVVGGPDLPSADEGFTLDGLLAALEAAPAAPPDLHGDVSWSWDTAALASAAAWSGAGPVPLRRDSAALDPLRARCVEGCAAGSLDDAALTTVDAVLGYPERLFAAEAAGADLNQWTVAPLTPGGAPVWFADVLVRHAACTGPCAQTARRFARWRTRADVAVALATRAGLDAEGPSRHLLPAPAAALRHPDLAADPVLGPLAAWSATGALLPTDGLPALVSPATGEGPPAPGGGAPPDPDGG